jgi:hypothetical protein
VVELEKERYPVQRTPKRGLRQVDFIFDGSEIRGLEQNPETKSRWAKLARSGKKVMQFLSEGRYVANVVDGKVTLCRGRAGKRRGVLVRPVRRRDVTQESFEIVASSQNRPCNRRSFDGCCCGSPCKADNQAETKTTNGFDKASYACHDCHTFPQLPQVVGFLSTSKASKPTGKKQIATMMTQAGYPARVVSLLHFGQVICAIRFSSFQK